MPVDLEKGVHSALVCALTTGDSAVHNRAVEALCARFGDIVGESAPYATDAAGYYAPEMGEGLHKQLVCFSRLIPPEDLYECKLDAIEIEKALAHAEHGALRRKANIDPGLLSLGSLVLSTSKCVPHRICIGPGIWAETTLLYQKGAYRPQPWTYLDYQRADVQEFLLRCRRWLRGELRSM